MEYEQMTADQIKIAKLEQALTEVMAELGAARALNEKLSTLIDNLNKKLEEKEMPVKMESNKRIRLEIPSASEDGNESLAEEEPLADSQSEEASSMDEDETHVQVDKTDDFPPLPPPQPVVQLPPPPKPTTKLNKELNSTSADNSMVNVDRKTKPEVITAVTQWTTKYCRSFNMVQDNGLLKLCQLMITVEGKYGPQVDVEELLLYSTIVSRKIDKYYNRSYEVNAQKNSISKDGFAITTDLWIDNFVKMSYSSVKMHAWI
ncbi:unnamed protein product [Hermetia illucens]|uniref:Hermes trasposase DNA-binding domain-containing protein n=1 Tax=Hermetia illucens TaxID=343691 RepID=A0A7R8UW87_HERIL|nr:unnamed protein product [Hermetia illucens]